MKVIINFGEKKVVVPCGIDGDISIRELINSAIIKYSKLVSIQSIEIKFIDCVFSLIIVVSF